VACRTHGRDKKCIPSLARRLKGKGQHLRGVRVDGRIILKWLLSKLHKSCGLDSSVSVSLGTTAKLFPSSAQRLNYERGKC
jgi:hypothetical protein